MALIKKSGSVFVFTSGKHAGETVESVARADRGYLQWARKDASENVADEAYYHLEEVMQKFQIPFNRTVSRGQSRKRNPR